MTPGTQMRPLRAVAEVALGRMRSPDRDQGPNMVPYLRAANVKDGALDLGDVKSMDFSPAEQAVYALRPGDVLVTEGAGSLAAVGAAAVWEGDIQGVVCFQNTLLRLRPRGDTHPRFLLWWARHAYASGLFASIAEGANIYHLGADNVRLLPVSVPSLPTQRRIADYLDAEAGQISSATQALDRVAALLRERRAVLLGEVMAGLHAESAAAMRATVPRKLSVYAEVDLGKARSPESADGPWMTPYLRAANVKNGSLNLDSVLEMNFSPREQERYALRPGDVLVTEAAGSVAAVGANAVYRGELDGAVCFQNHLLRIRAKHSCDPDFLGWWMRFAYESGLLATLASGAQILNLGSEEVRGLLVRFPDRQDQQRIATYLDAQISRTEGLVRGVEAQGDLLQERRQALVTAAVTGQLEIPGVVA